MCLVTEQKEPKILQEDLLVYKILQEGMKSEFKRFYYTPEIIYETEFSFEYQNGSAGKFYDTVAIDAYENILKEDTIAIAQGFHFITDLDRAIGSNEHADGFIYEFIVPKGSLVYLDETDLGVSNKILTHGKLVELKNLNTEAL